MRKFIFAMPLLVACIAVGPKPQSEAEAVTARFADAVKRFDFVSMADELHPDYQGTCYRLVVHIAETTEPESERMDFLGALGVKSLADLKNLTPKAVTIKLFELGSSYTPTAARRASLNSNIKIVGTLAEDDMVHVLYRSEVDAPELGMSLKVPSVVTLKRFNGKLKVIDTTEFDSLKAKMGSTGK